MATNQPKWQLVANLGDASPLDFGGLFVYVDQTGVYAPECVRLERITDDETRGPAERWQAHRFILEPCTYDAQTDTLSDNPFHPELAAWFAPNTTQRADRPQDGRGLEELAEFIGMTKPELIALFLSSDPCERAHAWQSVGDFHGFDNLDSYPETYTRKDLYRLYRRECFARSVRRTNRKQSRKVPSGETGPFAIRTI